MLFHSQGFVLGFLPACLAGCFLLGRFAGRTWALAWLLAASLFFYGWWNPRFVLLLHFSIAANFTLGQRILHLARAERRTATRRWLIAGVAGNLVPAGLVQIRRLPAAHRRTGRHAARHLPAAGDQLLHLPAEKV